MPNMNETPSGERVHIGFFGMRNAGKSSVVNALTGQNLAVVSNVPGTTTDLVKKAMELLPIGPVVIVDTPGVDDEGDLGEMRVQQTRRALRQCDIAVVVIDATRGMQRADRDLVRLLEGRGIAFVIVWNKVDMLEGAASADVAPSGESHSTTISSSALSPDDSVATCAVSARTGEGIFELKERIGHLAEKAESRKVLVADLLEEGDLVVLVVPIDSSAPKGRIILPQQMVLRDALGARAMALVCQPEELARSIEMLQAPPKIVITDSQAFSYVSKVVPDSIRLTSFSILMARYKGDLRTLALGAEKLSLLGDDDRVLISEGCTHHRQCEDIGTVKIPRWIESFTGSRPLFEFTSGGEFPDDLSRFDLIVHCGGCMLNEREMSHRLGRAREANVPIVNYGMAIAQMHGILQRALQPFSMSLRGCNRSL